MPRCTAAQDIACPVVAWQSRSKSAGVIVESLAVVNTETAFEEHAKRTFAAAYRQATAA